MTTSSDNDSHNPAKTGAATTQFELANDSWTAIADHLVSTPLDTFALWMDEQLRSLEAAQAKYVTRRTVMKSLRR